MIRALAAGLGFSLMGVFALLLRAPSTPELLPDLIFYGVLVLHTYFSVRYFSHLIPQDSWQVVTDIALVAIYFALALALGDGFRFLFLALCLFGVATLEYAPSLGRAHLRALMRRKIKYEIGGMALAAYSIILAAVANQAIGAWFFAVVYAAVTFNILFNERMYSLEFLSRPE